MRDSANAQRDEGDQVLQAVKFTDKKVNGLHLNLDEDLQAAGCFTEQFVAIKWVVEPNVMRGLQPAGATRVTLDVIIPSSRGLTPEKWKQTATLCPLDWTPTIVYCGFGMSQKTYTNLLTSSTSN